MCHCKAVFLIVVTAETAQAHYFLIQLSVLSGINWSLYQTTYNSPNMFNKGNVFEIFPNILSLFSNLTYFPAAFSLFKAKVGEHKENNNKKKECKGNLSLKGRSQREGRREGERESGQVSWAQSIRHERLVLNSSTHSNEVCYTRTVWGNSRFSPSGPQAHRMRTLQGHLRGPVPESEQKWWQGGTECERTWHRACLIYHGLHMSWESVRGCRGMLWDPQSPCVCQPEGSHHVQCVS